MPTLTTGLLPRRPETREMMASEKHIAVVGSLKTVIQPIAWIRDQRRKPSCVGQGFAAGIDAHLTKAPWVSAVDLWRDARRRQGQLEGVQRGTRAEYVIASMIERGWSPFKAGEDSRPSTDDDNPKGSLKDELFAHDYRQLDVKNYDISKNRVQNTVAALQLGYVVTGGWGLADKFFRAPADTILDPDYLNTNKNGHQLRIAGYDAEKKAFILQNSWGEDWSWCINGTRVLLGCCYISEEALEAAWDIDAVQVKI